ncbi:MAG: cytidylate kinase-like family protein [Desulforhopalus sp.]
MPIISISRGSYYHGRSVAEKLAKKLGYSCLSRDRVIENLEEFHLPEIKLLRGLNDAFSVLDRFPHGKQRFTAAIKSSILQHFVAGNVVYHGLVGHHFVRNISHVLKVRIIADTESRVAAEMARENISEEQARYTLKKDDDERRKWAMFLYGTDILDAETYNLILRIGHLSEDDAVDIIANAASLQAFQETPESIAALQDSALAALVHRKIFDFPHSSVSALNGRVGISLKVPREQQSVIQERIGEMLENIEGLEDYTVHFEPYF